MRRIKLIVLLCVLSFGLCLTAQGIGESAPKPAVMNDSICKILEEKSVVIDSVVAKSAKLDSKISEQEETVKGITEDLLPLGILIIVSLLLNLVLGYLLYRFHKKFLLSEIEGKKKSEELLKKLEELSEKLESLEGAVKKSAPAPSSSQANYQAAVLSEKQKKNTTRSEPALRTAERVSRPAKIVRYGSFRVDEDGSIKTEQRVWTDDGSSNHLFRIEFEENANTASYTINPNRKDAILADLQTFQNYTDKFMLSGGVPKDVNVVHEGKLRKDGREWVVTEKLKVIFN